jgi:hypothetical protein
MAMQAAHRGRYNLTMVALLSIGIVPTTVTAQPFIPAAAAPAQAVQDQTPYDGFFPEPRLVRKAISWATDVFHDGASAPADGFYPETGNMVTGSGWISGGPGYRRRLLNRQALFETSAAISWRFYKMAQARLEFTELANGHVAVGTQAMWRDLTQVQYFGLGPDSDAERRSQYRLRTGNIVAYTRVRPQRWLTMTGEAGWLRRPSLGETTGSFNRDLPETSAMFPDDPAVALAVQPNFLHGGAAIVADTRDQRAHPTRGGVYRAAWSTFRDQDSGVFRFHRYEAEAAHFVPLAGPRLGLIIPYQ